MTTKFFNAQGGIMDSTKVIGTRVENSQGENLGKIESLMLDLREGRILYAVLSFGGFLGLGEKLFPVPVESMMFHYDDDGSVDKDRLKDAPGYERDQLPSQADRTFASSVYSHYGRRPYWSE